MSPFANRSFRVFLWILLIVLPISYCLLMIVADLNMVFGWFFLEDTETGLTLNNSVGAAAQLQEPGLYLLQIMFRLVPLWIAFAFAMLVVLVGSLLARSLGKQPLIKPALSNRQLAGQLLSLLLLAYLMGSCIHFISTPWFKVFELSSIVRPASQPEYWWPYYGWPVQAPEMKGWTIYPPFDLSSIPMFSTAQAACVKLGTLLAILMARYVWLRRQRTLHSLHSLKEQ
jgi:hypothetical protein